MPSVKQIFEYPTLPCSKVTATLSEKVGWTQAQHFKPVRSSIRRIRNANRYVGNAPTGCQCIEKKSCVQVAPVGFLGYAVTEATLWGVTPVGGTRNYGNCGLVRHLFEWSK
jgi:hypothetical protein